MAATSPVHLEIAPLNLTPWPSTASSVCRLGSMGRQGSLAPQLRMVRGHTQEQVNIVQPSPLLLWIMHACWHSATEVPGRSFRAEVGPLTVRPPVKIYSRSQELPT